MNRIAFLKSFIEVYFFVPGNIDSNDSSIIALCVIRINVIGFAGNYLLHASFSASTVAKIQQVLNSKPVKQVVADIENAVEKKI